MLKRIVLVLTVAAALSWFVVPEARADVGSTIWGRMWDSFTSVTWGRMKEPKSPTVSFLQEAEKIFLGSTENLTLHSAIRDVYAAMRVGGLLLLALCTVISLAQISEAGMMGQSSSLLEWMRRFSIATIMTVGSLPIYSLLINLFNAMLGLMRGYLDSHWTIPGIPGNPQSTTDPTLLYTNLLAQSNQQNVTLTLLFAGVTLLMLLIVWFMIGGIRVAELAIAIIIAPIVWPVYLLPGLEDIPKTAFRGFIGLNAVLLLVVAMMRMAVRMATGGGLANTLWNYVPALSMLFMCVFLPGIIKRIVGQGMTGAGLLQTAVYALAGLKGISMAAGTAGAAGSAAATPPAQASVPQAPATPSAYPMATLSGSSAATGPQSGGGGAPPIYESTPQFPRQLAAAAKESAPRQIMDAPAAADTIIDIGQSDPNSNRWDTIVRMYAEGWKRGSHTRR